MLMPLDVFSLLSWQTAPIHNECHVIAFYLKPERTLEAICPIAILFAWKQLQKDATKCRMDQL